MRSFLKKNLLAIFVCLAATFAIASATTITRPYSAADYAGGTKAVGTKVNAEFQSIVDWINGGNISSTNIATSGVATTNIASFSVTSAKIDAGAVSLSKLAASSISVTSSSSAYSITSATPATITNLSTTFTASGRPIRVSLEPVPSHYISGGNQTYGSYIQPSGTAGDQNAIFFVRDASTAAHFPLKTAISGANTPRYPCSVADYTETGLISGVTYTYYAKASADAGTLSVINCRLVVREW